MKSFARLWIGFALLGLCSCTAYTNRVCTSANQTALIGAQPQSYHSGKKPGLESWRIVPVDNANAVGYYAASDGFNEQFSVRTCKLLTSTVAEISHPALQGHYMLFELVPRGTPADPFAKFDVEQLTAIESSLWTDKVRHSATLEVHVGNHRVTQVNPFNYYFVDIIDNKGITPEKFFGDLTWYRLMEAKMSDSGPRKPNPPILTMTRM